MTTTDPKQIMTRPIRADLTAADPDPAGGGEALLAAAPAPLEGEVGELVADLEADAECVEVEHYDLCSMTADQMRRAATLLQQQAAELAALRTGVMPVPVSERPWEREAGWRDLDGECWWCPPDGPPYWSMVDPTMVYGGSVLPFHAIPLPAPQAGEVV